MSEQIYPLGGFKENTFLSTGRKASNLDWLKKRGYSVPPGICLSSDLYRQYLEQTGLDSWLSLQLGKKEISRMRWEEIWDLSLTIRHKFRSTPLPETLQNELVDALTPLSEQSVVVRSSSLSEDSGDFSFAGLHDSIVNVNGMFSILEALKEVWGSLWTDRAMVYSERFNLDLQKTSMAVIIQELMPGTVSGVLFTENFQNKKTVLIEMIEGLNENLVSGKTEPDRVTADGKTGDVLSWALADESQKPLLTQETVQELVHIGKSLEKEFKSPLDIEWTINDKDIVILQVRPITGERSESKDSKEEMFLLKKQIEEDLMPRMNSLSSEMAAQDTSSMSNSDLEKEMIRRKSIMEEWKQIYIDFFIPFAHGVRVFAQEYNQTVLPDSPFEFLELLTHRDFDSTRRNRDLIKMADAYRNKKAISEEDIEEFLKKYGQTSHFGTQFFTSREDLLKLVELYASGPAERSIKENADASALEDFYLRSMEAAGREDGPALLDMARVSYKLRDDDNIAVSKIYGEFFRVEREWRSRKGQVITKEKELSQKSSGFRMKKRQITGTAASSGLVNGKARVVESADDLFKVNKGEILVCDSIDPNITFVIPLVTGIIERRGGMLIHGAIIAREYGIPCVTGVEKAASFIETGDLLTLDAFSGIVTIHT